MLRLEHKVNGGNSYLIRELKLISNLHEDFHYDARSIPIPIPKIFGEVGVVNLKVARYDYRDECLFPLSPLSRSLS